MRKAFVRLVPFLWFRLGLIHVWRLVPRAWRRRLGQELLGDASERRARASQPRAPVLVCGLLRSTTGFGWVARSTLRLAAEAEVEAHPIDLSDVLARDNRAAADPFPPVPRLDRQRAGTLILHFNPNQFPYVRSFLPEDAMEEKYVIASCAWELERIPDAWVPRLNLVDELWLPSRFVATAFENAGIALPYQIVPPLLEVPTDVQASRDRFGLGADEFLVFVAFSFGSGLSRKNPSAAVAAFRQAFPGSGVARLVVKVSDLEAMLEAWGRFREECSIDPRIVLVSERLDDAAMWSLVASCDVVLSLHRAEGFGMVPAQGMLLGKAVVATGWSGNLDFMRPENAILVPYELVPVADPEGVFVAPGLCWAEPDIAAAAGALRRLHDDPVWRRALGARARRSTQAYLASKRTEIVERLRRISGEPEPQSLR